MDSHKLRWWGWGALDEAYSFEDCPDVWSAVQTWLDLPDEALAGEKRPVPLEQISLPPTRLDDPVLASLRKLLGEENVHIDKRTRLMHTYGKSYCDLIRLRAGYVPSPPDAVVYPAAQCKVAAVLTWAAERDIAIVPFGGGSSDMGGIGPHADDRLVITLDLSKMGRVLSVDSLSCTARIQAGATGPGLESQLNDRGFTLGHFPQSFEFSTLGGWIATRSSGRNVIGYGDIACITQAVRAVTPAGVFEIQDTPVKTAGPNLLPVLIGSEGIYGVITEATMCLRPLPEVRDYRGLLFRSFEDGIAVYRALVQDGALAPTAIWLSDGPETAAYFAANPTMEGMRRWRSKLFERYLEARGYDWDEEDCALMIVGFEGRADWVADQRHRALALCGDHQGVSLGRSVGQAWLKERYRQPYLRDALIGHGVMVGMLETAAPWGDLMRVYRAMIAAIKGTINVTDGGPGYVMTHISYACESGVALQSTFWGRQSDDADPRALMAQWQEVKHAAADAILEAGGTLSHHHGVGHDHITWLRDEVGALGVKSLRALKQVFDPEGIMNPGVVLPVSPLD